MVAMKPLITLLPYFLALTTALPQGDTHLHGGADATADMGHHGADLVPSTDHAGVDVSSSGNRDGSNTSVDAGVDANFAAEMEEAGIDVSSKWNSTSSDTKVDVNMYRDKNPDYDVVIDHHTCKGKAEIALMKWRSNCKSFNAVFRGSCYTDAPSERKCCPLAKRKSCEHYWPAEGEWEECLRMRRACGKDCEWKKLTGKLQWCWKYAADI